MDGSRVPVHELRIHFTVDYRDTPLRTGSGRIGAKEVVFGESTRSGDPFQFVIPRDGNPDGLGKGFSTWVIPCRCSRLT